MEHGDAEGATESSGYADPAAVIGPAKGDSREGQKGSNPTSVLIMTLEQAKVPNQNASHTDALISAYQCS